MKKADYALRNVSQRVISEAMSILKAYLDENREKQSAFADRVGTTPATISRLCAGTLKPSLDLAHEIEAATAGKVRTETWIEAPPSSKAVSE